MGSTEMETFLAVLYEPTDIVEIRTFHRNKTGEVRRFYGPARGMPEKFAELSLLNLEGEHNIYIGANPRIREGGTKADVAMCRNLCADWDDVAADDADKVLADLPAPTLLLDSGHGVHAYWRLTEPMTNTRHWELYQLVLIERAKSDPKIKDCSRVMRLPGFINLADPDKDESPAPARIIRINAEACYRPEEVVGRIVAPETEPAQSQPRRLPSNRQDAMANLSRSTMQFMLAGAVAGERNQRLFSAACDLAGNGYDMATVEEMLGGPASTCGLAADEITAAIKSAFGKPRDPAKPDETIGIGSAFQHADPLTGPQPGVVPPMPRTPDGARPVIANVVDTRFRNSDGEDEKIRYYIPLPQIIAAIHEATGGWPRRAGGVIFAVNESIVDGVPEYTVRWIKKAENLFAWLGRHCDIRWTGRDVSHQVEKGKILNPHTKGELFAEYSDCPLQSYRAVELMPHHPPIEDLFYVPFTPSPATTDPTPLQDLINRLNPESENDRCLMLAALLTPAWGGEPGTRPAFVFTSRYGRGTGKTTTATVFSDIWGGAFSVSAKEDFDKLRGRLLGDSALTTRIAMMDNIKGRLSSSDIEGLITAKRWDGWKPYVGQASRPNFMTWYLTANTPALSKDIAGRSVIIHLGEKTYNTDFIGWTSEHVRRHRTTIITELIDILKSDPLCSLDSRRRDRFNAWQEAVLCRFENGNALMDLINARREEVDADDEDAESIAESVKKLVEANFPDHASRRIFISTKLLYDQLLKDGVVEKTFGLKGAVSYVRERCGNGPLTFLHSHRRNNGRGWLYVGNEWIAAHTMEIDEAVATSG